MINAGRVQRRIVLGVFGATSALAVMLFAACSSGPAPGSSATVMAPASPPVAQRIPTPKTQFGETRQDDYAWLREREHPLTIPYLKAENAYTDSVMGRLTGLQETLYKEMLSRIQETDLSAPYRKGDWWYYVRTEQGKAYPIYCRKPGDLKAREEVLLDVNRLAEGKPYMGTGVIDVSPDHSILAYSTDESGAEKYTLRFKNLRTGEHFPEAIEGTYYSSAWASDNRTFFYVTVDQAMRPHRLWRHTLGSEPSKDQMVYEEKDERYFLSVDRSRSERFIFLRLGSMKTDEVRVLEADRPAGEFRLIAARREGVEYRVDHRDDSFWIVTNDDAVNFKLVEAPIGSPGPASWKTVIPHREDATIEGVTCFADYLVIEQRERGLPALHVWRMPERSGHVIEFPEPTYTTASEINEEYRTGEFRFIYSSMVTPNSVYAYDMASRDRRLLKRRPVPGYRPEKYATERIWASAPDGKQVPVNVLYRKGYRRDGTAAGLLYGYGSYGANTDPWFDSNVFSLVDRGVLYAEAQVRGGSELGRTWYEDGRLMNKKHTFTDFIAAAEHLQHEGYVANGRLAIYGGSAGGLLMGAVTNMRPDLFRAVVAAVPFVDVINTMLDPSIPLTVTEWEQWGDPNKEPDYRYMMSYSPYDNVRATAYPEMLVVAGLNDPRVAYWEPAKWVARLRAHKTDQNLLLLRTHMEAGHGGPSGRYARLKESAFIYSFMIDRLDVAR